MATWRDKLQKASFRGVPFEIETSQVTTGRRVSVHEYPDRNDPFAEDLGKVGNSFRVDGYILGDDYLEKKAALKDAVEEEGPGELVHPYYGSMKVQVGSVSFDEDKKEGRICKVSFQFYEAGNNKFPDELPNKLPEFFLKAKKALTAAKNEFDKKFTIIKQAGHVVESARKNVALVADLYQTATAGIEGATQDIANLAYSIRNLKAEVNDLLQAPAKLSQHLFDSLALLEDAVSVPRGRFQAYASLFHYGANEKQAPAVMTPSRIQESENKIQFDNLQRRAGIIGAASQVPAMEFETLEAAIKVRDQLVELIEEQLLTTTDDDVYSAFQDLQASLVDILPDAENNLPTIQKLTVPTTTNSLNLTYEEFESLTPEEGIVQRNNISHPGFIIGGTTLEVINV